MRLEDRVHAIADFGFTERQARFLVTVMLHAGVCLPRQYASFSGIVHGQKTRMFFAKLVKGRYASAYRCRHNRGRIYQVHHKALYRAIGQTDSRHRRPLSPARVVRGLMLLDAVLLDPALVWLATDQDKAIGLTTLTSIDPDRLSHLGLGARSGGPRIAAEKFPIGIDPNGRVVLLYVAPDSDLGPCHAFVYRHVELLRSVPAWTLRVVVPPWPQRLGERYANAVTEELTATVRPALMTAVRRHFDERRKVAETGWAPCDPEHFDQADQAFKAPRFQRLYRRWLTDGDCVFDLAAEGLKHALDSGVGRVEALLLPHQYRHLAPLVKSTTRTPQGAENIDETSASPRPPSISAAVRASGSRVGASLDRPPPAK